MGLNFPDTEKVTGSNPVRPTRKGPLAASQWGVYDFAPWPRSVTGPCPGPRPRAGYIPIVVTEGLPGTGCSPATTRLPRRTTGGKTLAQAKDTAEKANTEMG